MGAGGAQVINLSGGDLSNLSDEQRQKLAALGIDPTALGGAAGQGAPASGGSGDDLDKIQKLADLRDRGALTDEEFEDEKRKLLERLTRRTLDRPDEARLLPSCSGPRPAAGARGLSGACRA